MELKKEIHTEKMPPVEVTALAEPCPDGQKITKAILTFRDEVPDVEQITVRNRTITGRSVEGKTVTLELDLEDELAWVLPPPADPPAPKPGEGAPQKPRELPLRVRRPVEVFVSVPGWPEEIRSTKALQPLVEDFTQDVFQGIPYSLYTPKDYDQSKKYPLVMFIPDAGPNGDDPLLLCSIADLSGERLKNSS